ncbi:MAG: UxaA family hydrolase [Bacillota bacterium]
MAFQALKLHNDDNVAPMVVEGEQGAIITVQTPEGSLPLALVSRVPYCHKAALRPIEAGEIIVKYGKPIGRATTAIPAGAHVHVTNTEGMRGRGDLAKGGGN